MDWQRRMNRAMDYLETHLSENLDYAIPARMMGCSEAEFRRMFSFLAQMPVSEYVRRRRLTLSVEHIRRGDKLIDVALRCGYESPAAFSRAFRKLHGISPSQARRGDAALQSCPRLTFKLILMEGSRVENNASHRTNIIGAGEVGYAVGSSADASAIQDTNTRFWDDKGCEVLGCTALPRWGGFVSEDSVRLLGDLTGKTVLEVGCGTGQSLLYLHKRGAAEIWGLDISQKQLLKTQHALAAQGVCATLVCSPMEAACGIPQAHFDTVVSIYGIGWTTDLDATFRRIASYLKPGGLFLFSWSHPIHKCVAAEGEDLLFRKSCFDESWYSVSVGGGRLSLSDRKLSTYLNALARAGFLIEEVVEQSDEALLDDSAFGRKARMLPATFVVEARKC